MPKMLKFSSDITHEPSSSGGGARSLRVPRSLESEITHEPSSSGNEVGSFRVPPSPKSLEGQGLNNISGWSGVQSYLFSARLFITLH